MADEGSLEKFVRQTHVVPGDKRHSPLPAMGKKSTFTNGNLSPSQTEIDALLIYFQLRIISMPKWHILEWHILIPFT